MLTADTITDDQIRRLRARAAAAHDHSLVQLCADALTLDNPCGTLSFSAAMAARGRCAAVLGGPK
jgi:hypothetical protein